MPQFPLHIDRLAVISTVASALALASWLSHPARAQQSPNLPAAAPSHIATPASPVVPPVGPPAAAPGHPYVDPDAVAPPTGENEPSSVPGRSDASGPPEILPPAEPEGNVAGTLAPAAGTTDGADGSAPPELAPADPPRRPAPFPRLPSLSGPVGLFHASTADVGAPHQLRLGFHGEYFSGKDVLIAGDSDQRLSGGLAVGYTLRRDVELFGALLNSSNRNQRQRAPDDRDPELIKAFGDLVLGGKWSLPLSSAASLGAELGLKFLSGVSDLAFSPSSTSWWVGPLFTYDLRPAVGIPLRFHTGASFYADNSSNLHRFSGVTRATKEAAMFGYGMGPSRLRFALAVEAPLEKLFPRVPLVAFVEYHLAYVTAAADADFQDYGAPSCGSGVVGSKPCTDNRDLQFVTLGVRAAVYRSITADVGMDIRLRSAGFPYGPPLPPYNVIFGVSYPFDVDSLTRTVVVTRNMEPNGPWKTEGRLGGVVRSATGGEPIAGAVVAVVGHARARAATDADGGFATPPLPAGPVELEVTAADFVPVRVRTTVVAGQGSEVAVDLAPAPPRVAKIHGRITDAAGAGVPASVKLAGAALVELKCETTGAFSAAMPPGAYELRVEAPGLAPHTSQVEARAGEDKQLELELRALVSDPSVSLAAGRVQVNKPIRFAGATAQLTAPSQHLLDAVADLLQVRGELKRVNISAHWDNSLPRPRALELTRRQAEAVRAYLVGRGLAETRLTATGEGATRPLVPNLSPANASRNRRVEFRAE